MTLKLGLIGKPIRHSLSPVIHTAAFRQLGLDATYELWEVAPEELETTVRRLREPGFLGANVTIPYKETVLRLVDGSSATVVRVGAANTLYRDKDRLLAENTDVHGIAVTLERYLGLGYLESALVLGAGGAAKAAVHVLIDRGCRRLCVVNRNVERAREILERFGASPPCTVVAWGSWAEVAAQGRFDLLINATPLGREGDMPIPETLLDRVGAVFDMAYTDTPLVRVAVAVGLKAVNGVPMLVYQAARSFELWFQRSAPLEAMMEAIHQAVHGASS